MTLILPPPATALVAPHGGMNQPWLEALTKALKDIDGANGNIAGLGTAAAEDIGTSGGKVPMCNTSNQWSKQQYFPGVTLTEDEALAGWDVDTKQSARLTMTSSFTLAAAVNAKAGATYMLGVDAGAFVLGFDTSFYKFPAGGTVPTTSGKCLFSFWAWSDTELWCVGVKEFA